MKEKMKFNLTAIVLCYSVLSAQRLPDQGVPAADYYESAFKLHGTALRLALHNIIDGHTVVSYSSLYTHYQQTDTKPNSVVWDMYSDKPGGTPAYVYNHNQKNCGNYSKEGDCYNREHSWPQSWFNSLTPAVSDLFHVYPTDGYVNGKRGNFPYGRVGVATWTSTNGSKVGGSFSPGYTGTVFEPIDAYKGDLARSQMYMSVRYYTEDGGWTTSPATNKSDLLPWYSSQLLQWHLLDTVSTKEIARNNAVFEIQNNRNPFIDHPEFAAEIWNTGAAPLVQTIGTQTMSGIIIDFSRYIDSAAGVSTAHYTIDHGIGNPAAVQWGVNNDVSKVLLTTSTLQPGTTYTVQISNLKSINSVLMNDTVVIFTTSGTAAVGKERPVPDGFVLAQNYPNPFNPSTTINFQIPAAAHATLTVHSLLGREIAVLVNGPLSAGMYRMEFNAGFLPSGLYFYTLRSKARSITRSMLLLK